MSASLRAHLRLFSSGREGHDVLSAIELDPGVGDERLLAFALEVDRVLLTEDKDFGELAFVRKLRHGEVVRFVELTVDQQAEGMAEVLEHYAAALAEPVMTARVEHEKVRLAMADDSVTFPAAPDDAGYAEVPRRGLWSPVVPSGTPRPGPCWVAPRGHSGPRPRPSGRRG
jgi:predicted nuclease of predicted toxin-antitoxin system